MIQRYYINLICARKARFLTFAEGLPLRVEGAQGHVEALLLQGGA